MATVYVICVPGTSETRESDKPQAPLGMIKTITDKLPKTIGNTPTLVTIECLSVPYTSGYGDRASYTKSVLNGKKNLQKILDILPEGAFVVLIGYSQGAAIAGDFARHWGLHRGDSDGPKWNLLAYYGLADPKRNHGDIVGPDPGGHGILGERGKSGLAQEMTYQFCAPGDIIASSDPNLDLFEEASVFTNEFWIGDVISWISFTLVWLGNKENQKNLRKQYGGIAGWFKFGSKLKRTLERGAYYIGSQVHTRYATYRLGGTVWGFPGDMGPTVPQWVSQDIIKKVREKVA